MSDLHAETSVAFVRTQEVPASPPPANITGLQGWMRENLFPTPLQSVLTVVMGGIAAYIVWLVLALRIPAEERVLMSVPGYAEAMGHKPRFLPIRLG